MATEEDVKIKSKDSKKEKKEKKRSESEGVHKPKKDKKEKKAEKEKLKAKVAEALDNQLQADVAASAKADHDDDDHPGSDVEDIKNPQVKTQLVYFALPLADEKGHKKIYKTIKKGRFPGMRFISHCTGAHATTRVLD
jgi:H/ACA ribonucleoprotein complex subunit 2